jgi:FAD dependent oxidoreductase TIGR03364
MTLERVVIVGGGVIGTMHAREACRRGWEVVHLEADPGPRRASVRNFGLVWVSGRAPGPELELALRARELWEQIARQTPDVGFRPDGSLTMAGDDSEVALLSQAATQPDAASRGFELLDAAAVRSVNPSVRGEISAALWCRHDAVVEPGRVLGALRRELETTGRYRWSPGRQAVDVTTERSPSGTGATVIDHLGDHHRGSLVLLCPGDRLTGLGGRVGMALSAAPLRRCRLQMMQTAPTEERLSTAIADGDSMRYYPAFDLPGRRSLSPARSETAAWGMQLLLVQRADGGLTIGDTHAYEEPFDFAVDEAPYDDLRMRAETILGWPLPPVVRRWAGVYSLTSDDRSIYHRERIDAGVWVVTGAAGRGMTLSPAIAEETWQEVSA